MNMMIKHKSTHLHTQRPQFKLESETGEVHDAQLYPRRLFQYSRQPPKNNRNIYEKIKQIPEIHLTKEEMQGDPIDLIIKLQHKYKEYGAVKICSCEQWRPPFSFKYTQRFITTRIQKIHRLKQGKPFKQKIEEYSIKSFQNYAESFQKNYKYKFQLLGSTKEAQIQNQYWQIVNGPSDKQQIENSKVTIQYAADLPVPKHGSGFPLFSNQKSKDEHFDYLNSLFNLNNIYKSPKSLLATVQKTGEKISGVTIPWVYMGMMFSSFCWHVQDLWLNSLNYSHVGATKTWYIIPESDKQKFDSFIVSRTGKQQLLNSITFMIDPLELIQNGIKVYKAYQRPGQYILTLFNAYHAGFSQGFNVGEASNVATPDSLHVIKKALSKSILCKNPKPPIISYDWLVASNYGQIQHGKQLIESEYKKLTQYQHLRLKKLKQKINVVSITQIEQFLRYDRISCHICKCYQYISCFQCTKCKKKFCLDHIVPCCGEYTLLIRQGDKYRDSTRVLAQSLFA